jgi:hypothetical protein
MTDRAWVTDPADRIGSCSLHKFMNLYDLVSLTALIRAAQACGLPLMRNDIIGISGWLRCVSWAGWLIVIPLLRFYTINGLVFHGRGAC